MYLQEFFQMLQYLIATNSIDIISGDFYLDLLKVQQKIFLDIFTDDVQMVKKPAQISGSFIDHFYIKRVLMEKFFTMVTVKKIYF